jgi:hypothetical protein
MLFTEITKNENISEAKNRVNRPSLLFGVFIVLVALAQCHQIVPWVLELVMVCQQ